MSLVDRASAERFQLALNALGVRSAGDALHRELLIAWSEPQRKYHTLQHLTECLILLDTWGASLSQERRALLELGLWFHDAVYDPQASDNEAASARWALKALSQLGVASILRDLVVDLVMATDHRVAPVRNDLVDLLLDIDLAILGASPARFQEYEEQIRQEYAWVPQEAYWTARSGVLGSFKARVASASNPLFRTAKGQSLLPHVVQNLQAY